MESSSKYYLRDAKKTTLPLKHWRYLLLFLLAAGVSYSCQRASVVSFYERQFTPEEQKTLAANLVEGANGYYEGSSAEQMLLHEALKYDPTNSKVVHGIGVPYLKRGVATNFSRYYGKAVELDPLGWTGWRGYLYLYFYRDYARAIQDFDAMDIITPNQVDYPQSLSVDYLRGIAYLMQKNYAKSLEYLDKHIRYESEITGIDYVSPKAFVYQALALRGLGQLATAQSILSEAIKIIPDNADLLYWRAKFLQEGGNLAAALPLLEQAEAAYAAKDYNRHGYVEEFYQLYPDDFTNLRRLLEQDNEN